MRIIIIIIIFVVVVVVITILVIIILITASMLLKRIKREFPGLDPKPSLSAHSSFVLLSPNVTFMGFRTLQTALRVK